jgi:RNA polymerase sigma factor for flagellar operon FliA
MDPRDVLQTNLRLIDGIVEGVCKRARVYGADAEDFAASVRLALIEDDYAVLRKWQGRASLATYLTVVVERLLADQRMHARGRWRPSVEASRLGPAALLLESLVRRDGRSIEAALPIVQSTDPSITRAYAEALLARLPERRARVVVTDLDDGTVESLAGRESADARALAHEARAISGRTTETVRRTLDALPLEDRMLLKFRFVAAMSIAEISRMTRLPQRPLYRRLQHILDAFRRALAAAGIDARSFEELIEDSESDLDFGLNEESDAIRQSISVGGTNKAGEIV